MKTASSIAGWARVTLCLLTGVFAAERASASFHLWEISQIYSNEDGSVQFIELFNNSNFEHLLGGQTLVASRDGGQDQRSYTFPRNLDSSSTANQHILLATGTIAGVEPDYMIPPNLLHITFGNNATLSLPFSQRPDAELVYTSIPTDGTSSLDIDGNVVTPAMVTNFAGDTGALDGTGVPTAYGYAAMDGRIETGRFMKEVHVDAVPWVYSYATGTWWYVPGPESDLRQGPGTWAYVLNVQGDLYLAATPWVYCFPTDTWWYVYDPEFDLRSGVGEWVYLMNMNQAQENSEHSHNDGSAHDHSGDHDHSDDDFSY